MQLKNVWLRIALLGLLLMLIGVGLTAIGTEGRDYTASLWGAVLILLAVSFLIAEAGAYALANRGRPGAVPVVVVQPVYNSAPQTLQPQPAQATREVREVIREIIKVPCRYCGTLNESTAPKCISCGAPT